MTKCNVGVFFPEIYYTYIEPIDVVWINQKIFFVFVTTNSYFIILLSNMEMENNHPCFCTMYRRHQKITVHIYVYFSQSYLILCIYCSRK